MSLKLPARPNLEQLRKQAKELLRGYQEGEAAAIERFRSLASFSPSASFKLSDAQHVIARDYGFSSWPKLKQHIDSLTRILSPAEMLAAAVRDSDSAKTARLLQTHRELKAQINEPMAGYGAGVQALLAAVQRSDRNTIDVLLGAGADINARSRSWSGGLGVLDECSPEMAPFLIERGASLDVHSASRLGMLEKLEELVSTDPSVAGARGAGGQTPLHCASTVEIARYLLDHGAEIDARDIRHESTPAQHMLRVLQARHYPGDRQEIARHLIARGSKTDILMAAALGDTQLVLEHLEAEPDCIRMCVTAAHFPKQDARSDGTIYIGMFGRGRTPHLIA
ncbi:MAG: ankyrin repeat domain-containing protein, partial [Blastocatellia bacterium]